MEEVVPAFFQNSCAQPTVEPARSSRFQDIQRSKLQGWTRLQPIPVLGAAIGDRWTMDRLLIKVLRRTEVSGSAAYRDAVWNVLKEERFTWDSLIIRTFYSTVAKRTYTSCRQHLWRFQFWLISWRKTVCFWTGQARRFGQVARRSRNVF